MTNDTQRSAERKKPRIAAGPLGRGVYLSDVVLWLMERHEATRVQAVTGWLLPVLEGSEHPKLYEVRPSGDATEIETGREWFAHDSGERRPLQQRLSGSLVEGLRRVDQWPASFGFGLTGAAAWIRSAWARSDLPDDVLHRVGLVGANFALSEADARRCWGWASDATTGAGPVPDASIEVAAPWSPERLKARLDELKGQRVHAYMQQLSKESGIADRKIRHMLNALGTPQQKAGHFDGLTKKKRGGRT